VYVSEMYASGFRCFGPDNPLVLNVRRGLNVLVGPNDSGKTAIIDVPRFVLWTRGDDFLRLEPSDFHVTPDGRKVNDLLIRCTFDGLSPDEESRFLEWCTNESGILRLHVCLRASLRLAAGGGESVITQYRAGKNADGLPLEGDLREYLKSTYLKPLRDAERELRSGRRSRLSRILGALPAMAKQASPAQPGQHATLRDTMDETDANVEGNSAVQEVQCKVNTAYLKDLSFSDDPLGATLGLGTKGSFDQLLERLELHLNPPPGQAVRLARGLGYNNLLFMAAELLLLQSHPEQIPFLLLEEPEAHLHPQHQTLFMQVLEKRAAPVPEVESGHQVQILLSTHSPQLAAGADLDAMIMVFGHKVFTLTKGQTKLEADDYAFLRRFLDATKANLFFARGLVIVEGEAENILLPALAAKIGHPFGKHGVSIVNVGHRGLFRYSRIFQREDNAIVPVPVAAIPDRDIPPDAAAALVGMDRQTEGQWEAAALAAHMQSLMKYSGGTVKVFPSEQWTLEFDLARKPALAILMHQAVQIGKGRANRTGAQIAEDARAEVQAWQADNTHTADEIATLIFTPLHKKQVSKVVVAEQLAALIEHLPDDSATFRAKLPAYLVDAIEYVTATTGAAVNGGPQPNAGAGPPSP
jgi:putative ATP-dependent endonuclease of the OLD family